MTHYSILDATDWERLSNTIGGNPGTVGKELRPHLLPWSEEALAFIEAQARGIEDHAGHFNTDIPISLVTVNGAQEFAYRFLPEMEEQLYEYCELNPQALFAKFKR